MSTAGAAPAMTRDAPRREAFALVGPTACGKSRIALRLAERFALEIVSVDSAQVYCGMDIGTAKPTREERARVPHHLIDLLEPTEGYSAGRFRADAIRAVEAILARGRLPLLVGGTMLYYRALAHGLDALPAADAQLRRRIDAEAQARGWPALHAELAAADPLAARRIAPGDAQRIQRALEVLRITGQPLSALHTARDAGPPFALRTLAVVPADRAALHRAIAARLDAMLQAGFIDEVRALQRIPGLHGDSASMRAIGYRQVWAYLEGRIARGELRDKVLAATRQLAKRQITWLRAFPDARRLPPEEAFDALAALFEQAAAPS